MFPQVVAAEIPQDHVVIRAVPRFQDKYVKEQIVLHPQEISRPRPYPPPPPRCMLHIIPSHSQDLQHRRECKEISSIPDATTYAVIPSVCVLPSGTTSSVLKYPTTTISAPRAQRLMDVTTRYIVQALSGARLHHTTNHLRSPRCNLKYYNVGSMLLILPKNKSGQVVV